MFFFKLLMLNLRLSDFPFFYRFFSISLRIVHKSSLSSDIIFSLSYSYITLNRSDSQSFPSWFRSSKLKYIFFNESLERFNSRSTPSLNNVKSMPNPKLINTFFSRLYNGTPNISYSVCSSFLIFF